MRLLLLGGPSFLGRAIAELALACGDELTFFNRGRTNPDLYPEAEKLRGDRDGGLDALRGRAWDAVVDTSGYFPRLVRASAELLDDAVAGYCFVSTVSVYADLSEPVDERSPVGRLEDETVEELGEEYENYGALKALCEEAVRDVYAERALIVRPGLIVGPHDPTGRFTYWPHRVARGGEVLVPGALDRRVELIDVRDLAAWLLGCCRRGTGGTFNATIASTMGAVLASAVRVTGANVQLTEVDEGFLVDRGVGQWRELPLWVDTRDASLRGFMETDSSLALDAGLTSRALDETVADTLTGAETVEGVGLTAEREAELLAEWHAR